MEREQLDLYCRVVFRVWSRSGVHSPPEGVADFQFGAIVNKAAVTSPESAFW